AVRTKRSASALSRPLIRMQPTATTGTSRLLVPSFIVRILLNLQHIVVDRNRLLFNCDILALNDASKIGYSRYKCVHLCDRMEDRRHRSGQKCYLGMLLVNVTHERYEGR